jgi:creatinine amidohydrolase
MHADELETSILLAAHPTYVRAGWQTSDHTASDRRYLTTLGISAYTKAGSSVIRRERMPIRAIWF